MNFHICDFQYYSVPNILQFACDFFFFDSDSLEVCGFTSKLFWLFQISYCYWFLLPFGSFIYFIFLCRDFSFRSLGIYFSFRPLNTAKRVAFPCLFANSNLWVISGSVSWSVFSFWGWTTFSYSSTRRVILYCSLIAVDAMLCRLDSVSCFWKVIIVLYLFYHTIKVAGSDSQLCLPWNGQPLNLSSVPPAFTGAFVVQRSAKHFAE